LSGKKRKLPLPLACFIAAAVCAVLFVACLLVSRLSPRGLYDQRAAEYFASSAAGDEAAGMNYTQVSAFLARGTGYGYMQLMQFRDSILKKYEADGMSPSGEGAHLWLDAASGTAEGITVKSESRSSANISATAIMGDFFFFHPTTLLTGQAINPDAVSKDVIMLDAQTAWDAFGSYNIVGARAEVNGVPCVVGGVFEKPEGDTSARRIYVSFEFLMNILPGAEMNTLEFVLPGPVSGYGLQIMYNEADKTGLLASIPEESRVIVENSSRFNGSTLLKTLTHFGEFVSQTKAIALPYWENAARIATVTAAVYLLLAIVFAVFPCVLIIILIVKAYRRRGVLKPWFIDRYTALKPRLAALEAKAMPRERKNREKISTELPETVAPDENPVTDADLLADFSPDLVQRDDDE
jgi:hypothetical protein